MKKSTFFTLILGLMISFSQIFAQDSWVNKNENENYVQRHECSFVQSGNKFIMFGGREQAKRLDIYDYTNNSWSQGAAAPIEFNHFQAVEYDGLIWVVGAFKTNNFPNELPADNIYIYNPALNIWMEGPEIPNGRKRGGAGVVVHNNKFYLVAGNTKGHNGGFIPWLDAYDPLNNTWQQLKDAPRSRDHFSAAIIGDKIYAASGRLSGGTGGTFAPLIPQVDVYDLNKNSWTTLNNRNIPTPRAGASVVTFGDELFVIGGEGTNPGPAFKKVEAFNPRTNSWTTKANLNFGRHGTQAIVSGQGIHIAGGSPARGGGRMHNMEVYQRDAPIGTPVQESLLNAPNQVVVTPNQTKDIKISSSGGNAGNFITNVRITGTGASSFSIQKTLSKHLIKSGTSQNITIKAAASTGTKTANLVITYDNGKVVSVNLVTSNTTPPPPNNQTPFGGTNRAIPGTIQAEDFDNGGQGIAYNDTGIGNNGNAYRTNENVDIQATSDAGGGFNIGWVANQEYLEYTVNAAAGNYTIETRVASANGNPGDLKVALNNRNLGTFAVSNTGGWQNYTTLVINNVNLAGGNDQVLRLTSVNGGSFNINWIKFNSSTTTPPNSVTPPIGQVISLRKSSGDKKFVTTENTNNNQLSASSTSVGGNAQKFLVEAHPKGGIVLKSLFNNNYIRVFDKNTNVAVRAVASEKGDWTQFIWKDKGTNKVALKSVHTNKWIQANWNKSNAILFPRGNADGDWEIFDFTVESDVKSTSIQKVLDDTIKITPNPIDYNKNAFLNINSYKAVAAKISTYDIRGKLILTTKHDIIKGNNLIDITILKNSLANGMYIIIYEAGNTSKSLKIVVRN